MYNESYDTSMCLGRKRESEREKSAGKRGIRKRKSKARRMQGERMDDRYLEGSDRPTSSRGKQEKKEKK